MLEQWLTGPRGRGSAAPPRDIVQSVSRAMQLMEIIGSEPGMTVKQMARRLDLNRSTVYHLVRTLVYEGYLIRDELGNYTIGPAVADRYRDLCRALRGADDSAIGAVLQRAVAACGYSHYIARFVGGRVTITDTAVGPSSPRLPEVVPGFDAAAHATAVGKALLATLTPQQRERYLTDGMRRFTAATFTQPGALEVDLAAGRMRRMQWQQGEYRAGVACVAVPAVPDGEVEQRVAVGCALPIRDLRLSAQQLRARLAGVARQVARVTQPVLEEASQ